MQYKRLNKNITSEDSETDLIKFLKDKQMRTRRASNVLFMPSESTTPESTPLYNRTPRKSLVPSDITQNYRRRLSLAVPDQQNRQRGASVGNVALGIDSPARRRLRMKRRAYSEHSEDHDDFKSSTPKLGTLSEHEDEDETKSTETDETRHPSPNDRLLQDSPGQSAASDKRNQFKKRSSSVPSRESLKKTSASKHVPSRKSPSVKRKLFQDFKTDDNELEEEENVNLTQQPSPLRKNVSYQKAMSLDSANDENTNV